MEKIPVQDSNDTQHPPPPPSAPPPPSPSHSDVTDERPLVIKYINGVARVLGVVTVAILLWAAVETYRDIEGILPITVYLIAVCIIVVFFEILWFLDCLVCCQRQGCCCKVWSVFLWVDSWKKGVLYIALSIPCFALTVTDVLAIVGGVLLDITAIAYILIACQHCECFKSKLTAPPIVGHIERETQNLKASLVNHDGNEQTNGTSYDSTSEAATAPPYSYSEHSVGDQAGSDLPGEGAPSR